MFAFRISLSACLRNGDLHRCRKPVEHNTRAFPSSLGDNQEGVRTELMRVTSETPTSIHWVMWRESSFDLLNSFHHSKYDNPRSASVAMGGGAAAKWRPDY